MAAPFEFQHRIEFSPADSDALLRQVAAAPGVFALRGPDPAAEPYLTRTADLRRRLRRLLAPPEAVDDQGRAILSKRLNLREKVRFIDYTRTGSEFESSLVLYCATRAAFGPVEARRRLRLHAPFFLRMTHDHAHPRVYTTNKLSRRAVDHTFGPFPSRAAAERYGDAALDLFKLRRCHEDLQPHPDHPGCAYGEMKKCLAPCKQACTPGDYASEASRVMAFFTTRGESMLQEVAAQREAASEAMDFEQAAALHKQWERVKAAAALADDLVRPVSQLRAVVLQEAAPLDAGRSAGATHVASEVWASTEPESQPPPASRLPERHEEAAVFLLSQGRILGPERLSTLGVRAVREQTAVGSSLFAQPLMLSAVPLPNDVRSPETSPTNGISTTAPQIPVISTEAQRSGETSVLLTPEPTPTFSTLAPEDRTRLLLAHLSDAAESLASPDPAELSDYFALFRRWYYRPEKQRQGEVILPNPDGTWPLRRILNAAARVALGPPSSASAVDREAFKSLKTKIIHEGREGVEREVPVLPRRSRTRKAVVPGDVVEKPASLPPGPGVSSSALHAERHDPADKLTLS